MHHFHLQRAPSAQPCTEYLLDTWAVLFEKLLHYKCWFLQLFPVWQLLADSDHIQLTRCFTFDPCSLYFHPQLLVNKRLSVSTLFNDSFCFDFGNLSVSLLVILFWSGVVWTSRTSPQGKLRDFSFRRHLMSVSSHVISSRKTSLSVSRLTGFSLWVPSLFGSPAEGNHAMLELID